MTAHSLRERRIRFLGFAVFALSLLVVAVSAYLRLEAAGLGCANWPACYGQVLAGEPSPLRYGTARMLHRAAASTALILTLALLWCCWRPVRHPAVRPATLLLILMLALAVLGFFSADPRRVLIGFLNIVGGLGLVSFSWRVVLATEDVRSAPPESQGGRRIARHVGIACTSLAVLSGAWLGASYAATACTDLPFCAAGSWTTDTAQDIRRTFSPLLIVEKPAAPGDGAGTLLHHLHRGFAAAALMLLALAAARENFRGAWSATATAALVATLGAAAVGNGLPLAATVAHGTLAAAMLAALAGWMRR